MTAPTTTSTSKTYSLLASVLLFLVVFVQWQVYDFILTQFYLDPLTVMILYVAMPAISLMFFALFVKMSKSTFRKSGYRMPSLITLGKCLLITIVLIAIYILLAIAPGITGTIGSGQFPLDPSSIIYRIANAILFSLASESIFRGYIFRNVLRSLSFFPSLYVSSFLFSLSQISIASMLTMSSSELGIYVFTNILTTFASGLFLGFFFYKTGWSLVGPAIFRIGVLFFFEPTPILSVTSIWWMGLTAEIAAYAFMILLVDSIIVEPHYRRKKYGLEN